MKFKLTIDMDNAAFEPEESAEVSKILTDLAEYFSELPAVDLTTRGNVYDTNGNRVGEWKVTK